MPRKLTLREMRRLAAARDGLCLSETYRDSHTPLEWQCAAGHRWRAIPHSVRQGHWCKQCADQRRRKTLEDLRLLASRRQGALLSERYVNSQTRVQWRCALGHEWSAIPNSVRRGTWCPRCATGRLGSASLLA